MKNGYPFPITTIGGSVRPRCPRYTFVGKRVAFVDAKIKLVAGRQQRRRAHVAANSLAVYVAKGFSVLTAHGALHHCLLVAGYT